MASMAAASPMGYTLRDGMPLIVCADGVELASGVLACVSSTTRRRGLLGRTALTREEGLLLVMPGRRRASSGFSTSIHTIGMRFPIAAAWLDPAGRVVHAVLARPWRPNYASPRPASYILELHSGHLSGLQPGVIVTWQPRPPAEIGRHGRGSVPSGGRGA